MEIQINTSDEDNSNAQILLDIANENEDTLYAKHDGSIEDGFELVSHPMTLDYLGNQMNWQDIFEKTVNLGYRSHQTRTCGFHIHINRSFFRENHEKQEDAISRVVYFVEKHWTELLKFSMRTEEAVMRWASRYGIITKTKYTYKNAKDRDLGRYVAVNLENYSTIEIRIFRGTLNFNTFIATLQLMEKICNKISSEEILKFQTNGKIIRDKFDYIDLPFTRRAYLWDYGFGFNNSKDKQSEDEYLKEIKTVASYYGYTEDDIDKLLAEGFALEDIEELIYCYE